MMIAESDVKTVVEKIERKLEALRVAKGISLGVVPHDYRVDDEWLCVIVVPTEPGVRGSDYADSLSQVEKELRAEGIDHVLLLPEVHD